MSISQQLIQLAQNVGALTADTNAIFEALRAKGVNVPANAQLSDVADMIEEIEVPPHQNEVEIGGRWYPYVQIGNQLWLAENLDYSDANITIGGESSAYVPKAYYYNQDEATNGWNGRKINLLYNAPARGYLDQNASTIFPDGWHICSNNDMEVLISFAGGSSVAGIKLSKGDLNWQSASWSGTNDFGFSWLPSGTRYASDGGFHDIGEEAALCTSNNLMYYTLGDGVVFTETGFGPAASVPIRLVKNVT